MYQESHYPKMMSIPVEVSNRHALPRPPAHIYTGGGGNVYKPTEQELAANRAENEKVRTASFSKEHKGGLKGLADKAKDLVKGSSHQEK